MSNSLVPWQIRPDILSGLIWCQTVCTSYDQKTPAGKELRVEHDQYGIIDGAQVEFPVLLCPVTNTVMNEEIFYLIDLVSVRCCGTF